MEKIYQEDWAKDRAFGEYEAPEHLWRDSGDKLGRCQNCGALIYDGEEAHWFDMDGDSYDELVCGACAHSDEVLDAVFGEKSVEEKLWILETL